MRGVRWLAVLMLLLTAPLVAAGLASPSVEGLEVSREDGTWFVRVHWTAPWGEEPFSAVREGVPLGFRIRVALFRERSWWRDPRVAAMDYHRGIYFNRLTRQYRVRDRRNGERFFTRSWSRARERLEDTGPLPLLSATATADSQTYYIGVRVEATQESLSLPARLITSVTSLWGGRSEWRYHPLAP